jgi:hypothetical protein
MGAMSVGGSFSTEPTPINAAQRSNMQGWLALVEQLGNAQWRRFIGRPDNVQESVRVLSAGRSGTALENFRAAGIVNKGVREFAVTAHSFR